jgi:hypothetical protein
MGPNSHPFAERDPGSPTELHRALYGVRAESIECRGRRTSVMVEEEPSLHLISRAKESASQC